MARHVRKTDDRLQARGFEDGVTRADVIEHVIAQAAAGDRARDLARVRGAIKNGHRKPRSLPPREWIPDQKWIEDRLELMFGPDERLGGSELENLEIRLAAFERDLVLEDHSRARDEADHRSQIAAVRARDAEYRKKARPSNGPKPEDVLPQTDKSPSKQGEIDDSSAAFPAASVKFTVGRQIHRSRKARRSGSARARRLRRIRSRRRKGHR